MNLLKNLFIVFALLAGVAFLIASWYIILIAAVVVILYMGVSLYTSMQRRLR